MFLHFMRDFPLTSPVVIGNYSEFTILGVSVLGKQKAAQLDPLSSISETLL